MNINKLKKVPEYILQNCGTIDPFELCDKFDITVRYKDYNLEAMKGYCTSFGDSLFIYINSNLSKDSQKIVCAHELGHALLHSNAGNHFNGGNIEMEHEANLFAAYLLLDESKYDIKFENMNSYLLKSIIDEHVK